MLEIRKILSNYKDRLFIMKDLAAVEKAIGKGAKKMLYWK
jgi:hypothetical protein